jgi:hypothetical protein
MLVWPPPIQPFLSVVRTSSRGDVASPAPHESSSRQFKARFGIGNQSYDTIIIAGPTSFSLSLESKSRSLKLVIFISVIAN